MKQVKAITIYRNITNHIGHDFNQYYHEIESMDTRLNFEESKKISQEGYYNVGSEALEKYEKYKHTNI